MNTAISDSNLANTVAEIVSSVSAVDMHTHLYPPSFDKLLLWGIDNLLNYHYLIAEFLRCSNVSANSFWKLNLTERSNMIWKTLFNDRSPISDASKGVLNILSNLNIDSNQPLTKIRLCFEDLYRDKNESYLNRILNLSNVKWIVMTNDPFDPVESLYWNYSEPLHPAFKASLRIDKLLHKQTKCVKWLNRSYTFPRDQSKFIDNCIRHLNPLYIAVSLGNETSHKSYSIQQLKNCVIPAAIHHSLPVAIMLDVDRSVNPSYKLAGDGSIKSDLFIIKWLCKTYPSIPFLVACLSRENQYDLIVLARKFKNLMPFGTWWFLNNEYNSNEINQMRSKLLGQSYIFQHSDSRVIEHLIYKWSNTRAQLIGILTQNYRQILSLGKNLNKKSIKNDVALLLNDNFLNCLSTKKDAV